MSAKQAVVAESSDSFDETRAAMVAARLDRLPGAMALWRLVFLISLSGLFEFYELSSTAYIAPGLVRAKILTSTTENFFGLNGVASYIAATFTGMFIGTFVFGFVSDRAGRRPVFTYSLLWYSGATVMTALQTEANWLNFWRLMTGIGLGVELVTADAYLSELVPAHMRGRAFAVNQVVSYLAVPIVAFLAWRLVPLAPFGIDGWRFVTLAGGTGAVAIWWMRRGLPESPRWLAANGRVTQAEQVVDTIEQRVMMGHRQPLAEPRPVPVSRERGSFLELFGRRYARSTIMLLVFHLTQTVGVYGFSNWVPTFLMRTGIALTASLGYTLGIACVTPIGPLLLLAFADRIERKWQLVGSAFLLGAAGLTFAQVRNEVAIVVCGALVTLASSSMSQAFHAYQSELFPTRIRTMAIGFVYSISRISGALSGFIIAYSLQTGGVAGAVTVIAACMGIIVVTVALLGPRTNGRQLEQIAP